MDNTQTIGNKKTYTAILVFLVCINIGAFYLLYKDTKAVKELKAQKTALEADVKNITDSLHTRIGELEALKGHNAELDSIILVQQQEIEQHKKSIEGLQWKNKMTSAEMTKAKALIAEYQTSMSDMKRQIEQLIAEKQILTEKNQQLTTDLDSEKRNTQLLSEQNKGLSKKVEIGSLLQLRNIAVAGIRKKGSGKETEVSRVKQLESLRITFETGDNKVLEPGDVDLYVRIINPKGETVSVADQGSGSFKLAETGENIQYSKKANMEWNQTNKKVAVYWSQNIKEAGTYTTEIYQSGYLIGKGQVELK